MSNNRHNIPYGFLYNNEGKIHVHEQESEAIKIIFDLYLDGFSLGKIVDKLAVEKIISPNGNPMWTRDSVNRILSNERYVPYIIDPASFAIVQTEKKSRANHDSHQAKLYRPKNILSGILICSECGSNYRRITRPSGERVWRCANRVEHGKSLCKISPTLKEQDIKSEICRRLHLTSFDEQAVKCSIEFIKVDNGGMSFQYNEMEFEQ